MYSPRAVLPRPQSAALGELPMKLSPAAMLCLLSLAAAPAAQAITRDATIVDKVTAPELAEIMKGSGYEVELKSDDDPYLVAKRTGTKFFVNMYGCDRNPDPHKRVCDDAQFISSYNAPDAASPNEMNKWNSNYRFGKAYVNAEGKPTVTLMMNLKGGATKSYLRAMLKWWSLVLRDFETHIGW